MHGYTPKLKGRRNCGNSCRAIRGNEALESAQEPALAEFLIVFRSTNDPKLLKPKEDLGIGKGT
jgi:hypothetical protein